MNKKTFWALILAVFVPSLWIRLHPTTSESFQYDAVESQIAAREGVVANAWDASGTYWLRRHHPPLLSYIIQLNNRLCGNGAFGARIFSIVLGSLTCLAVAIAIAILLGTSRARLAWAVLGGWLLCFLPVHLYVSRTSNWDTAYGFFATITLLCIACYAVDGSKLRLYAAALFGTCAFLTCELGLALLPAFFFLLIRDSGRLRRPSLVARWAGVILLVLVLFTFLWPAGILRLDLVRTLVYRWRDSLVQERNLPWYAFYTTLFHEAAGFTLFIVFGIIATLLIPITQPGPNAILASRVLVASLPFWIYATTVFALSLKQRLVYLQHIVDMFPPLVIAVCVGLAVRADSRGKTLVRWTLGLATAMVVIAGLAALNPDPDVVGPQEHPGFLGVSDALRDHPGARIYCHDTLVLRFYLPHASIEEGTSRSWTPEDVESAKRGKYDFVVFDRARLNQRYPTADSLVHALAPEYRIERVVPHRRTGEPVAWILSSAR